MKPTQEQVITRAREAGLGFLLEPHYLCSDNLQVAFTLAYEAGRKDENEVCAIELEMFAEAIRARRGQ